MCPRTGLDRRRKSQHVRDLITRPSSPLQVTVPTMLFWPTFGIVLSVNLCNLIVIVGFFVKDIMQRTPQFMCCISLSSSRKSVSDNSSAPEESENIEDVLKSPGKQRHFKHRRRNLISKNVGTELFTVSPVLTFSITYLLHERREHSEAVTVELSDSREM